jgi:polyhydroxybutyrate depolymerase
VALHGGLGDGAGFESNSRLDRVADAGRFIVVYPDGFRRTWNGGYCCGPAQKRNVDDVGFLVALVDSLSSRYRIDPARVFALGHSNGGIMAYRLACERPDKLAAIGVVAGSMGGVTCRPSRPVSIIHIHGDADRNHPIDGGVGSRSVSRTRFNSAMSTLEQWVGFDHCVATPQVNDTATILTRTWSGCGDGTEIVFHTIKGGSHAWPGGTRVLPRIIGPPSTAIDASSAIWEFFATHGRG